MKKLTKILALIMAGLLVSASLFACGDDSAGGDDEDEDEEESEVDFSDYEKLSPEEVFDAMEDGEEMEMTFDHPNVDVIVSVERDGNKFKYTKTNRNDDSETILYGDLKTGSIYEQNADGNYEKTDEEDDLWDFLLYNDIIKEYFAEDEMDFFVFDDNYEKDGDRYDVLESVLEDYADYFDGMDIEAYMERDDTKYEFVCNVTNPEDDETVTAKYTIEFKDVSVKLPKIEEESGEENPDPKPAETTPPVDQPDEPDQPQPPVTTTPPDEPDEPEEPDAPSFMSPEELLKALLDTEDATITFNVTDNGNKWIYTYEKDGEKLMASNQCTALGVSETIYVDMLEGVRYYSADGKWYKESFAMQWEQILENISSDARGILALSDSYFTYNPSTEKYELTADAASQLELRSATLAYNEAGSSYIYSIVYNDLSADSLNIKFSVWSAIKLPSAEEAPSQGDDQPPETPSGEYVGLNPSEIYSALLEAEDITIVADSGSAYTKFVKDGDLLEVSAGANEENVTAVYYDLARQYAYAQQNGAWASAPLPQTVTWESLIKQMNLSSTTYIFVDSYYESFDESDTTLNIQSSLLAGSTLTSSSMVRDGNTYTVYENMNTGVISVLIFSFDATTVTLPTV